MTPARRDATGPAGAIAGLVRRADGQPVAGARVMIAGASPEHQDLAQETGPGGEYRFGGLAPGRYTLAAYGPDGAAGRGTVEVEAGAVARLEIELAEAP